MKILGVDWGEKKIGIALAEGFLAEPYSVVHNESEIKKLTEKEGIQKIVVGVSESMSADKARAFGNRLAKDLNIPVVFQDETLSSIDAQRLSIESGMSRKKRKGLVDSYAAAIMLQSYLDTKNV